VRRVERWLARVELTLPLFPDSFPIILNHSDAFPTRFASYRDCPSCGNNCFAFRTACNKCQTPKPEGLGPAPTSDRGGGGYGGGGGGRPAREGDWWVILRRLCWLGWC
jgi:hypothetical protein